MKRAFLALAVLCVTIAACAAFAGARGLPAPERDDLGADARTHRRVAAAATALRVRDDVALGVLAHDDGARIVSAVAHGLD